MKPKQLKRISKSKSKMIFNILENESIPMNSSRVNTGKGRTQVLGKVRDRRGNFNLSSYTKKHMELYKTLKKIGKEISPNVFTGIQLNKNYVAKKHIDKNNIGESVIIGFGDYEGGLLCVNYEGSILKFDIRRPVLFNGSEYEHWVEPITKGTRYSTVFFKTPKPKKKVY